MHSVFSTNQDAILTSNLYCYDVRTLTLWTHRYWNIQRFHEHRSQLTQPCSVRQTSKGGHLVMYLSNELGSGAWHICPPEQPARSLYLTFWPFVQVPYKAVTMAEGQKVKWKVTEKKRAWEKLLEAGNMKGVCLGEWKKSKKLFPKDILVLEETYGFKHENRKTGNLILLSSLNFPKDFTHQIFIFVIPSNVSPQCTNHYHGKNTCVQKKTKETNSCFCYSFVSLIVSKNINAIITTA